MKMKFLLLTIVAAAMQTAGQAWAGLPVLKDVQATRVQGVFVSELLFDRKIDGEEFSVDFINETVQVNIPGATISEKKRFEKLGDEKVKSLYTYQVDEDVLRHRIILKDGASAMQYDNKVSLVADGNKLIVRVGEKQSAESAIQSVIQSLPPKTRIETVVSSAAMDVSTETDAPVKAEKLVIGDDIAEGKSESLSADTALSAAVEERKAAGEKKRELSESEIPVLASAPAKTSESGMYWRFVMSLLFMGVIAAGIFAGLKYYRHNGLLKNKQTSIKVLTQHYLGPKKSLAIVRVAGESILIGITDHNITPIKTLSLLDEEVPEIAGPSFAGSLTASLKRTEAVPAESPAESEEFSIKGLKDLVSNKLSGMREL